MSASRTSSASRPSPCRFRTFLVPAATNYGYWQGRPAKDIDDLLEKYPNSKTVLHRHASHLWVLTPDNLVALLEAARARRAALSPKIIEI